MKSRHTTEPEVTFPQRNSRAGKCVGCGERWQRFERFIQVCLNGKVVRGERYCLCCENIARVNNPALTRKQFGDQRMAEQKERNRRESVRRRSR